VWGFVPPGEGYGIRWEKGKDELKSYEFGARSFKHYFCGTCGTSVPVGDGNPENQQPFNVRTLRDEDIDFWSLPKTAYGGKDRDPPYVPPSTPPHDLHPSDGQVLHTGGCHCKAVEFVLASPPLEEDEVAECNCSICQGNGCLWIYPNWSDIAFSPTSASNLTRYTFGKGENAHYFCQVCGVNVYERRGDAEDFGLNVRLLNEVNAERLGGMKIRRTYDASAEPKYKCP